MSEPATSTAPPRHTNRLIHETSPYLLQHAHNPVDWYPWGHEALARARAENKPILLSIGYSSCHWCHVMERESFENEAVADLMNRHFVSVKVDREERPDLDDIYMAATLVLNGGQGGWPMTVFLTSDQRPFFAGTYFPPTDRFGRPGFSTLLTQIADLWERRRDDLLGQAETLTAHLGERTGPAQSGNVGEEEIRAAVRELAAGFDPTYGGFGPAPKFPPSTQLGLLLRHHRRAGDAATLAMVTKTLDGMAQGGMYDQIGGGFARYSTDERWLVPHFEKMLYDNALLAVAYAEAWQVTRRRDFARVTRQTLDYLLREMTSPEGGLYSATDADSEGEEGRFFVWTEAELREALGPDADAFIRFHGVTPAGNFEGGRNVLHVPAPDEAAWEALTSARARLHEVRERRPHPLRDEKILAGWNGLAISALAFGGRVLGERRHVDAAARAADFVLGPMVKDGRLQRSWRDGRAGVPAYLDDHAFLAQGLIDLHEATLVPRWLAAAIDLCEKVERLFGDPAGGGWFTTAADHERLLVREKPTRDGAEPSGASVALLNALRLEAFTGDARWRRIADAALRHYRAALEARPTALGELLLALDFATDAVREVVLVWPEDGPGPEPFLEVLRGAGPLSP